MNRLIIFTFILIIFSSCKKDKEEVVFASNEMKEYLQSFINEGQKRGVTIKNTTLTGIILQGYIADSVEGRYNHTLKTIFIDTTGNKYKTQRESLIFHEFSHALLGRGHDNNMLPNGDPRSIMHYCISPDYEMVGTYHLHINNTTVEIYKNNLYKREYYLDELFNPTTKIPEWAK